MEQAPRPDRITMKTIGLGVLEIFNLERGLLFTLWALLVTPGTAIRAYLEEDRTRLVPPFRFLILAVAVGTFFTVQYFDRNGLVKEFQGGLQEGFENYEGSKTEEERMEFLNTYMQLVNDIFNNYFNAFLLLGVPILALMTFWFFRKKLNFAEHLVINSYLTGFITVIYIALMPILWFVDYFVLTVIYAILSIVYSGFLYIQLFREKIVLGIVKTLIVQILYYTIYFFIIFATFLILAILLLPK